MAISDAELKAIVGITGAFENSGDPYQGVSGNFDGQGISCGVLQWNIGQNSLQPLVLGIPEADILALMPQFGAALLQACRSSVASGLAIVRSWQVNNRLRAAPRNELKALMGSARMRATQNRRIGEVAREAETVANAWAADRGGPARTPRELAFFFDVLTQNGSMQGLNFAAVKSFIAAASPDKADDLVCDWLKSRPSNVAGARDGFHNADLWRDKVPAAKLDLFMLAYLRSQKSTPAWRVDVLNRKGAIAFGKGRVHQTDIDLSGIL
jgi:hypothetical protein